MSLIRRFWFRLNVLVKFLLIIVPLTVVLTVTGLGLVQLNASNAATERQISQFDAVGQSAAEALSEKFWNYNIAQAQAILDSLLLIPNVISVSTVELANGQKIENSGFKFDMSNPSIKTDSELLSEPAAIRTATFPIINQRPITNKVKGVTTEVIGELTIQYSLYSLFKENRSRLFYTLFASLPIALALIIGTAWALNLLILKPILAVTRSSEKAAQHLATDTEYQPIVWKSGDQLGVLVTAFNELRINQAENTQQLKREREALQKNAIKLEEVSQEAQKARDEAIAANAAKSRFLAIMSHELRTPLNTVIGVTETIEKNYERLSDEKRRASLGRVNSAGRHLLGMINEILDLSKIDAGKMKLENAIVKIPDILADCLAISEPLAAKNNNSLKLNIDENLPACWGDATRIRQILLNLLSNAAKFTKEDEIVLHASQLDDDMVQISVQDHGIGMNEEQMKNLFQDFQQAEDSTARKYGGTGLGLSISRKLARAMQGDISLTSSLGEGACFTVKLPIYRDQDA